MIPNDCKFCQSALGSIVPTAKARIDQLIGQIENKTGPAFAQLELDVKTLANPVEEKKKAEEAKNKKKPAAGPHPFCLHNARLGPPVVGLAPS